MICGQDKSYNVYFCLCTEETYNSFPDLQIQLDNNVLLLPRASYILIVTLPISYSQYSRVVVAISR